MRNIALAACSAAALLTSVQSGVSPPSARTVDDALVLKAVVEHTILPAVRRASDGSPAPLALIADRSIPLCKNNPTRDKPCRIPENWQQFLVPDPAGTSPGLIDNEQRRRELVQSVEARNLLPHALPAINHPSVVLIPADD